jgi:O-antigen/teichoic acid export membrane protein
VYFAVFMAYLMAPLDILAPTWMFLGVGLIIVSSFLLGEQQARMEAIKS